MFTEHEKLGPTSFAGGIWTWSGFLPHVELTWKTMETGLKTAARHHAGTVMATMWGDDGAETNHFLALSLVPLFSEYCWRGVDCRREDIEATGTLLTGLPSQCFRAYGSFYPDDTDRRVGKALIYCDLLYPLGPSPEEMKAYLPGVEKARAALAGHLDRLDCAYADALFALCEQKIALQMEIRQRYLERDMVWLEEAATKGIPALLEGYERLRKLHKALWLRDYKRNGWEVLALRYGSVMGRLTDVQETLLALVKGDIDTIAELEEVPMDPTRKYGMQFYNVYVSPVYAL